MTRNARNRFVAWLGIAAMWLAIVAPVVSQTLAARLAADDPQALLCTVDSSAADPHASHASVAPGDSAHAGHHDATTHFDACAYCGLLAHNLPVANDVATNAAHVERVARVALLADIGAAGTKSFNAARPRAPPVFG